MPTTHRGIVIVHGVGEHARGAYLGSFVEPLARYLKTINRNAARAGEVWLEVDADQADRTSWATLHLTDPDDPANAEEWHIREAWWHGAFRPSAAQTVLSWAVVAGVVLSCVTVKNVLLRNLVRTVVPDFEHNADFVRSRFGRWLTRSELQGRPAAGDPPRRLPPQGEGVWAVPGARWWKAILDAVIWLAFCFGYSVLALVALLALVPFYLLLLNPLAIFFPAQVGKLQRALVNGLVNSIGDQQAVTSRLFALAGTSNEVASALWPMICAEGIVDRAHRKPGFTGFKSVTVVAHSGGCVVSYDAIAGHQVQKWLAEPPPAGFSCPQRINWVTAGSGLNLAWRMRRASDAAFWRPISRVNWLNIYARYDPIPQGPPPDELVTQVIAPRLPDGSVNALVNPPYVNLRVANTDLPTGDHTSYWQNQEEVLSRVVHMIRDDRLAARALDPQVTDVPADTFKSLSKNVVASVAAGERHRNRVVVTPAAAGVILTVIGALLVGFSREIGDWVLGAKNLQVSFFGWSGSIHRLQVGGHELGNVVPEKVWGVPLTNVVVGVAAVLLASAVIYQAAQLGASLAGWVANAGGGARLGKVGLAVVVLVLVVTTIIVAGLAASGVLWALWVLLGLLGVFFAWLGYLVVRYRLR